jgi:hypothetical protein
MVAEPTPMLRKKRCRSKNCASLATTLGRSRSPPKVTAPRIPMPTGT